MRPPALAEALVAAAAPTSDYEIIAGDLHEEYLQIMCSSGPAAANRWYWAQVMLSMPSLLSYSRSNRSALRQIGVASIALAALLAMLIVLAAIDTASRTLFGIDRIAGWVWFCINYTDAVVFGAILALLVRTDGLRVAFCASLFLVLCFVIPALAGNPHSQAPLSTWIQLLGGIPAMCIGAGLYQAVRRRINSTN